VAFDFFHTAGSMYVETQVEPSMRASGQGLFFMMSNGFGALFGSLISGIVIDKYFTIDGEFNWQGIWLSFAGFVIVTAILFIIFFKNPVNETAHD
jgi:NHS family xanthosine MFS transporter